MTRRSSRFRAPIAVLATALAAAGVFGAISAQADSHRRSHRHGRGHTTRLVSWNLTTTFTYAAPGQPFPAGSSTLERIVYNPRKVDKNGDVVITGHQHYLGGTWADPNGPAATPVSNLSVFNVKSKTLSYQVEVTHGTPIALLYTPAGFAGVYSQADGSMLEGGKYVFDSAGPRKCNARTWHRDGTC